MYSRNIVIAASLAVLTLAAPTPGTANVQRQEAVAERRDAFSLTGLVRDVLKRHALIEAIPDAAYDIVIDRRSEDVVDESDVLQDRGLTPKSRSDNLDARGGTRGGGGGGRWIGRRSDDLEARGGTRGGGGGGRWIGRSSDDLEARGGTRGGGGGGRWIGRRSDDLAVRGGTRGGGGGGRWIGRRSDNLEARGGTRGGGSGGSWVGRRQPAGTIEA